MSKAETTMIRIRLTTKAKLDKLKVHPRQSYDEVLDKLLGTGAKGKV